MSCHQFGTPDGSIQGWICLANIFKFPFNGRDYYFEYHRYLGPIPVKKCDLSPRSTNPTGFWKMIEAFEKLSKEDREEYRIYG